MINQQNLDYLSHEYNSDLTKEIFTKTQSSISFFFDLSAQTPKLFLLTGSLSTFGLSAKDVIPMSELVEMIETDNALAEVEGKHNFIERTLDKLKKMRREEYLYLPFKGDPHPIWLYIHFSKFTQPQYKDLVFGSVLRVFNRTPNEIIYYQKTYQDPMTKLFTRETLKLHLNYLTNFENSYGLYIDIDGFKRINDKFGHHSGDQFIKDIANYFISKWEQNVIYYRLGGDEFFVYVYDHSTDEVIKRANQLIHDISHLTEHARICHVSASIGIVPINPKTRDYYTLLDIGDQTMYASKNKGPGIVTLLNNI